MSNIILNQNNFKLDFLFGNEKEPISAFNGLKEIFQDLYELDNLYISSIHSSLEFSYKLEFIEFSSIRTWVIQAIKEIPDDAVRDFEWKKLVGHFLLKLKYLILKHLENDSELNSKEQIQVLNKRIEDEKRLIFKDNPYVLLTEVNMYLLINSLEQLINTLKKLLDDENIQYQSLDGKAIVNNKVSLNKAKILWELGDEKFESETTETLKIKKMDMLSSNSMWSFKLKNKSIEAKIVDYDWLARFHSREYTLLPEDSLKVKLKCTYVNQGTSIISKPLYEITKIMEITYPTDTQENLF
ncbi:MAG: hypothetical protein ACOH2A_05680 [Sphingobacteriaceae bacterium]